MLANTSSSSSPSAAKPESWLARHKLWLSFVLALLLIASTALVAFWVLNAAHFASADAITSFDQRATATATKPIAQHASSSAQEVVGNYRDAPIQDDISSPSGSDAPSHRFVTQPHLPDPVSMMMMPIDAASPVFDAHEAHAIELERIQLSIVEAQRARIAAYESSVQPTRRVQPPEHEHGSGLMDSNVGHIFLRSAPRARAVHVVQSINETEAAAEGMQLADPSQRAHIAIMDPAVEVQFGSVNSFPSSATASTTALAAPFIVHFKSSAISEAKATLSALIAPAAYHVDRYIHLHNFLLVPNDANATASSPSGIQSNEVTLLRLLDSAKVGTQNGIVESWHKYEERDKIEPHLCQTTHTQSTTDALREFCILADRELF